MVQLSGTPIVLDQMLRPLVRFITVTVGLLCTAALVWLESWWLAPLPLALSFVTYEIYFWMRGDVAITVTVNDEAIVVVDAMRDHKLECRLDEVHVATLHHRETASDRREAVLVLYDKMRPRLALRMWVEPGTVWTDHDVHVDKLNLLIGGYAGLIRALAPAEVRVRQDIDDPAAQIIGTLRERLPPAVWRRKAARVWRGEAPVLDTKGLHFEQHTGMLVIQGDQWALNEGQDRTSGPLTLLRSARSERRVVLEVPGSRRSSLEEPEYEEAEIPLLLLELDPAVVLALPAPVGAMASEHRAPSEELLHAQLPEGAGLLWHILQQWPRSAWPAPLRKRADKVLPRPTPSKMRQQTNGSAHRSAP